MKKLIYIFGVVFTSLSIASAVDKVNLKIIKHNGEFEIKQVQLQKVGENSTKLVVKKSDMPSDVNYIDVIAENAQAMKGEKGFWLTNRGYMGEFLDDNGSFGCSEGRLDLPYYAMKNPRETFIGIIDGMRWQCSLKIEAKDGVYTIFPRFRIDEKNGFDFYEDLIVTFYKLPENADYNKMAKTYRAHKFAKDKEIVPMKQRFKTQPLLVEHSKALSVRCCFGYKQRVLPLAEHRKTDYTFENEPPVKARPFSWGIEVFKKIKAAGVDKVYVCTEGWQDGGYDGRTPSTWPICPEAGGEEELKKYIKACQDLGFLIDGHMDYTDAYTCSRDFTKELVCKHPSGKLETNGAWAGGKAYNICLEYAWHKWIPAELEKIRKLGFKGGLFYDVFGAVYPYRCCDPKHPANRAKQGEYHYKIMKMSRPMFGVIGQEGGFDDFISQVDFINYPSTGFDAGVRRMSDAPKKGSLRFEIVPFWELVYHDITISSPYRMLCPDAFYFDEKYLDHRLKMAEFCGRPIFYGTHDYRVPAMKIAYDFYKTYRHLVPEEMTKHTKLEEGIYKTNFANGAYIVVNYNKTPFKYRGIEIPEKGYIVKDKKAKAKVYTVRPSKMEK